MATQGPNYPSTVIGRPGGGSANAWLTPENAGAADGAEAQITAATFDTNDKSEYLEATGFGFSIPSDATIDGITVEINRRAFAGAAEDALLYLYNGMFMGTSRADTVTVWPVTAGIATYGGPTDKWGLASITPSQVNGTGWGVLLQAMATGANTDIGVDYFRMTVHYTAAAVEPVTGTGGVAWGASLAGSGAFASPVTGTGGVAWGAALTGASSLWFEASGGVAWIGSLSGNASLSFAGAGSPAWGAAFSSAGSLAFSGAGSLAWGASSQGAGNVFVNITASGGVAFSSVLSGAGETVLAITASGGVTFTSAFLGSGALGFVAAGGVLFAPVLSGAGEAGAASEVFTGSGGVSYGASLAAGGTQYFAIAGSGGVAWGSTLSGAGTYVLNITASGGVRFSAAFSAAGTQHLNIVASGGVAFLASLAAAGGHVAPITTPNTWRFALAGTGVILPRSGSSLILRLAMVEYFQAYDLLTTEEQRRTLQFEFISRYKIYPVRIV